MYCCIPFCTFIGCLAKCVLHIGKVIFRSASIPFSRMISSRFLAAMIAVSLVA